MAFTIRALYSDEQKYTYRQSTQIEGQPEVSAICVATSAQAAKSSFPLGLTTGGI